MLDGLAVAGHRHPSRCQRGAVQRCQGRPGPKTAEENENDDGRCQQRPPDGGTRQEFPARFAAFEFDPFFFLLKLDMPENRTKSQNTNYKSQTITNDQNSNVRNNSGRPASRQCSCFGHCLLEIDICLSFVFCDLGFICNLYYTRLFSLKERFQANYMVKIVTFLKLYCQSSAGDENSLDGKVTWCF